MKLTAIIAAAAASMVSVSAQAAQIVVRIDATAFGEINTYTTGVLDPISQPYAQNFSFDIDASNLDVGQSMVFNFGSTSNAGLRFGEIYRIGGSETSQLFVGSDFKFAQIVRFNGGYRETLLNADTFDVRQIFPAPVPEPATWAMMILGFGAVGYSMRRKKAVVRFT